MKFNFHGLTAAAVSVFALISSPAVAGILPPHVAAIVGAAGIVYQAFSKPAAQPDSSSASSASK